MSLTARQANRLIHEKSPYLLQHAYNPVNWFPWCDEAFTKAKAEAKPVFLSIGYSTCHWCHVMERESFEDEEVAQVLNKNFISIKVDREERPDVDHYYMEACTMLTGHGGWPLSCFLTPDKKPFFIGTYFPKQAGRGIMGFIDLLNRVALLWEKDRQKVIDSGNEIFKVLAGTAAEAADTFAGKAADMDVNLPRNAYKNLELSYDNEYGGFGTSPKFPSVHNLLFLLRYGILYKDNKATALVVKTLECMADGGIRDHIGGGFSRYSTDRKWLVPHFEKMMYDNAMLLAAYSEASAVVGAAISGTANIGDITGEAVSGEAVAGADTANRFKRIAEKIVEFCLREMRNDDGGFFTALDADSEGEEGKFYLWDPCEVKEILGSEKGERFCKIYDVTERGNFEGKSIPNTIGRKLSINDYEFSEECFEQLLKQRNRRIPPFKDDKVLASVNGLMAAGLAIAGRIFARSDYISLAADAVKYVLKNNCINGRMMSSYRDGRATGHAGSDEYAYIIWAMIELYQATLDDIWLDEALSWLEKANGLFLDERDGLYFISGSDVGDVPVRQKNLYDGALPCGNSVMALNLVRLWHIIGDDYILKLKGRIMRAMAAHAERNPHALTGFLCACLHELDGGTDVVLVNGAGFESLRSAAGGFRPFMTLSGKDGRTDGKAEAQVCRDKMCMPPVTEPADLAQLLDKNSTFVVCAPD